MALWIMWFVRSWRALGAIAAASLAAGAVLLPLALGYQRFHRFYGFSRTVNEISALSADLTSFLAAPPQVTLWGFTASLAGGPSPGERELFLGLTIVILALVGYVALLRARRTSGIDRAAGSLLTFYLAAAAFLFLCSMGPTPAFFGRPILFPSPYRWLMALPFFAQSVRAPARFALPALLALATAAALAFNTLRLAPSTRRGLAALALAGIAADSWSRIEILRPPESWHAPPQYDFGTVVELPLSEFGDFAAMYRATQHGHPVANGHSGFFPAHYLALQASLDAGTLRGLDALAGPKPALVVLDQLADADGRWTLLLSHDPRMTKLGDDGRWTFYGMAVAPAQSCQSRELTIASTRKHDDMIEIDLAQSAVLCELRLSIGAMWTTFPKDIEVATSTDGIGWTQQFTGSPAALLVRGALANPRDISLNLRLGDAPARFLRLRRDAPHGPEPWPIAAIRVTGSST
jgi:hypothetical protein